MVFWVLFSPPYSLPRKLWKWHSRQCHSTLPASMLSNRQSFCWTLWSSSADLSSSNNNNNNDNPINVSACQWAGDNKSTHCISSMQTQNCTNRLNFLHRETKFLDNVFTTQRLDYKTFPNLHVSDHIKKTQHHWSVNPNNDWLCWTLLFI